MKACGVVGIWRILAIGVRCRSGRDVFEAGCGTGLLLKEAALVARSAVGLDLSRGMLSNAPTKTDELQMRTFWRRWHQLVSDNPALELTGP